MRKLLALAAVAAISGCAADPAAQFSWEHGLPDRHFRYATQHQINGEWTNRKLTNDRRIRCVLDEMWRDPITAVRLEERESGRVIKTLDCTDS